MKEYKIINLNPKVKFSKENDLKQCEETLNEYVSQGWELFQIVPNESLGSTGVILAVIYKEK